jgi:hypothetical protein
MVLSPLHRPTVAQCVEAIVGFPVFPVQPLSGRAANVLGPGTFRPRGPGFEFDAVALSQIIEALARDSASVEEIILARLVPDEPKSLIFLQLPNRSRHRSPLGHFRDR